MDKRLVFIASSGRTGTQFLGDMLGQAIEDCWSAHEPDMFAGFTIENLRRIRRYGLWHMVFGRALGRTGLRSAGMRYLTGKDDIHAASKTLRRERDPIYSRRPERLIVDSYWRWWMFAGEIDRIWPGAKTIMIIRDPKEWISSVQARHTRWGLPWLSNFPDGGVTPTKFNDEVWARRWGQLSPIGRLAWQWRAINSRLVKAADDSAARLYRYEDLFFSSDRTLEDLISFARWHGRSEFARLPFDLQGQQARNASGSAKGAWHDWRREDRAIVDDLCGELSDRFRYARALPATRSNM